MRKFILAATFVAALAGGAAAQDADIEGTITKQFDAFKADDFATALTFASPSLQRLFGTPENFGRMVTQGYPMVWRHAETRFLELTQEGAYYLQRVLIVDEKGTRHVLEYRMQQTDGGWRIAGVQILDSASLSA